MKKQMKKKQKGFTLVEMIVVIAIIGVLAAMMVPSLLGYIDKANTSNNRSAAATIGRAAAAAEAEVPGSITSASNKHNIPEIAKVIEGIKGAYEIVATGSTITVVYSPKGTLGSDPGDYVLTKSTKDLGFYPEP